MDKKTSNFTYFSYAWTVVLNIITVFVVLAIFDSVEYNSFETIIVCITIIIFLNLQSFYSLWAQQKQRELFAINDEFKKIRILLKEKNNEDDEEYEKQEIENSKNKFKKQQTKIYINIGFSFLIYVITLFYLFGAL